MDKITPRFTSDEDWTNLKPHQAYAIRANIDEQVTLRLGSGIGLYLGIAPTHSGERTINSVNYENGEPTLVAPLPKDKVSTLGRTDESEIKLLHAIVSRKHAQFRMDGNIIIVTDMGSTNGTYVHKNNPLFNIEEYIKNHPPGESGQESTLDFIHEEFGPDLDDFLRRYQKEKEE